MINYNELKADEVKVIQFSNKKTPSIVYGKAMRAIQFVTPKGHTYYPRVTGNGNFYEGNPYAPASEDKAQFTIDINLECSDPFLDIINTLDDKLLEHFASNQETLLKTKGKSVDEIRMLQHRNVKYKDNGMASLNLTVRKHYIDQVGNARVKVVNICDEQGKVKPDGQVMPGDMVRATMQTAGTWCMGGKFGLRWDLGDVAIIERAEPDNLTDVPAFSQLVTA